MPNRYAALAISTFWLVMMTLLVQRDVLPQWRINQRLDLRAVSKAVREPESIRWAVLHEDQRIGSAVTEWLRKPGGWLEYRSQLELQKFPFLSQLFAGPLLNGGIRWQSSFHISPDGNLHHFLVEAFVGDAKPFIAVNGRLAGEVMKMHFRSGTISHEEKFFYEPHSMLATTMGPIDRLPNLSLGQQWQYRVMNPITHSTDAVRCEVIGEKVITWRGDPVPTYVVEQHYGQIRGRSWVARDGSVLRQEVPLGHSPLVLEKE